MSARLKKYLNSCINILSLHSLLTSVYRGASSLTELKLPESRMSSNSTYHLGEKSYPSANECIFNTTELVFKLEREGKKENR